MKAFTMQLTMGMELVPFTNKMHHILIAEGYTHLRERNYVPDMGYFKELNGGLIGYTLYPCACCESDSMGKMMLTPDANLQGYIRLNDPAVQRKYGAQNVAKNFLLLDRKNNYCHRLLFRKIKSGLLKKNPNKQLKQYRYV